MDLNRLLNSKHIRIYRNKCFYCACVVENGMSEPYKIKIFGIRLYIPHWLRKRLRHKAQFKNVTDIYVSDKMKGGAE